MPNPFEFIREIREMNDHLCVRLDTIIEKIDELVIELKNRNDWYGDGR